MGRLQGARVGGRGGSTTTPTGAERTLPRVQEGGQGLCLNMHTLIPEWVSLLHTPEQVL